jgi:hypothetical protein
MARPGISNIHKVVSSLEVKKVAGIWKHLHWIQLVLTEVTIKSTGDVFLSDYTLSPSRLSRGNTLDFSSVGAQFEFQLGN